MKRLLFLSIILSLSYLNNISAQRWLENKSALKGIANAGSNTFNSINHITELSAFTEEVKEKDHPDDFNKDNFFVAGIPGKIEAESWDAKSGGMYSIASTDPTGGGMMVVGIGNGDYMDYNVNVASTGTYSVAFRIATPQAPVFQLKLGNTILTTINIPITGSWTTWATFTVNNIPLSAGPQTLRLVSTNIQSCNFNWMDFSLTAGNLPPDVYAGDDQNITLPTNSVTLTGSAIDPDGVITSYQWSKISGPAASIASPTAISTVVNNLVEGVYQFEFKATDNGMASTTDIVMVTVNPIPVTAAGNWNLAGNSGTNSSTNFLGTTDNVKLGIRTNNLERVTVLPNGKVGINNTNPLYQLEIDNATPDNHLKINGVSPSIFFTGTGLGVNNVGRIGLATINNNFTQGTVPGDFVLQSLGATSNLILGTGGGGTGNGNERARINSVGYFGIATLNPTAKLHVNSALVNGQTNPSNIRFENLSAGTGTPLVMDANGYVFSGSAGSSATWNTTGNTGTNPTNNFIGTSDNNRLVFRTNNTEKMTILPNGKIGIGTTNPLVSLHVSDNPGGMGFPYEGIVSERAGDMRLGVYNSNPNPIGINGGGAAVALAYTNYTNPSGLYPGYDMQFGALSNSSYYLRFSSVQRNTAGTVVNALAHVMIMDNNGNVGINLGPSGNVPNLPTAKFHTNGTVRHENLPTGTGNVLVVDANGNVFKSTAVSAVNIVENSSQAELNNKIKKLEEEIEALRSVVNSMKGGTLDIDVNTNSPFLYQNTPNPFSNTTSIRYYLPSGSSTAVLEISDLQGRKLKNYQLTGEGKQSATINANELSAGTYIYTLVVNGKMVDSKKMILTR